MPETYEQSIEQMFSYDKNNHMALLVKDPHWLYTYWEISDEKKKNFINEFGNELWEKSEPVLKITNISKNIFFYVGINDFSNDWYINIPEPNCTYMAEVGRKISDRFFVSLVSSNYITAPCDNVSADTTTYFINHMILKNGIPELSQLKIYGAYDYKQYIDKMQVSSSLEFYGISLSEAISGISSTIK